MGVPGLPPVQIGVDAEIAALKAGVGAIYPIFTVSPNLSLKYHVL